MERGHWRTSELVAEDEDSPARLEGVPELAGDFTFELEVRGREGGRDRRGFVLSVAEPLQVLTPILPPGVLGETYAATAVPAGGRGPVRWVFDSDALVPPGIRIRREERVVHFEGRTGAIGRFVLPVEIEDADGRTASSVLVLEVVDSGFRLKIDGPLSLRIPACTPFEATWEAIGGGKVGRSWTVTAPSTISIEENPDSIRATGFFDPQAPNATVDLEVEDANLESDRVTAVLEVAPSTVERHGAVIHRNATTAATRFDLIDLCHVVPELAKSGGFSVSRALSELTFSPEESRLAFAHEGSSGEPKISVFEMAHTPPTREVFTVPDFERGPWFATDRFLLFQQETAVEVRPGATFDFLRFFVIDLDASNPEPRPIDLMLWTRMRSRTITICPPFRMWGGFSCSRMDEVDSAWSIRRHPRTETPSDWIADRPVASLLGQHGARRLLFWSTGVRMGAWARPTFRVAASFNSFRLQILGAERLGFRPTTVAGW